MLDSNVSVRSRTTPLPQLQPTSLVVAVCVLTVLGACHSHQPISPPPAVHEAAKAGWVMADAINAELLDANMMDSEGTSGRTTPLHEAAPSLSPRRTLGTSLPRSAA